MGYEDIDGLTKKDKIIMEAKKEPFQSLESIAEKVGTTNRYCRTAMETENVKIRELRKQKAERLESEVERLRKQNKQLKQELGAVKNA